ncbi:MAG: hypothetical protein IJQ06_08900 [Paludibacteraceae bacterium]|nr:hypothetical protein [Paludibacteraceae bacterium]
MTTAQNHTHYYPGATYMHALTLAIEAYISQFSKKEIQASAVQIIMQLDQTMAIAVENAGLAEAMLENYPTPVIYDAIDLEQFLAPLLASNKSKID